MFLETSGSDIKSTCPQCWNIVSGTVQELSCYDSSVATGEGGYWHVAPASQCLCASRTENSKANIR